jgi:small multidrug resistance pump
VLFNPDLKWVVLAAAISVEISATMFLRASHGFSRLGPTIVVLTGYAVSFALLSQVLRAGVPVGVAYAIWSATGTAAVAILGRLIFSDPLRAPTVAGILLIIGGVVTVQVSARR